MKVKDAADALCQTLEIDPQRYRRWAAGAKDNTISQAVRVLEDARQEELKQRSERGREDRKPA